MVKQMVTKIYALTEPGNPGAVRYIGKANAPEARIYQHLGADGGTKGKPRKEWLDSLTELPGIIILEECDISEWPKREQYWIAKYLVMGADLVNDRFFGRADLEVSPVENAMLTILAIESGKTRSEFLTDVFREYLQSVGKSVLQTS